MNVEQGETNISHRLTNTLLQEIICCMIFLYFSRVEANLRKHHVVKMDIEDSVHCSSAKIKFIA